MGTWQTIWQAALSDFSDLPDLSQATRITVRLILAALLGALIGFERERRQKAAGLRTLMLVSVGSALFVIVAQQWGAGSDALSRVVQGIIVGIGFLGAGTILNNRHEENIKGLTTAASIWLMSAIGVAVGAGQGAAAILTTALALIILAVLPRFERWAFPATPPAALPPNREDPPIQGPAR